MWDTHKSPSNIKDRERKVILFSDNTLISSLKIFLYKDCQVWDKFHFVVPLIIFLNIFYIFLLPSPGSPIGVLRATDADGDGVTYTTDSDYFNVEASTGKVTLALALDREVAFL